MKKIYKVIDSEDHEFEPRWESKELAEAFRSGFLAGADHEFMDSDTLSKMCKVVRVK